MFEANTIKVVFKEYSSRFDQPSATGAMAWKSLLPGPPPSSPLSRRCKTFKRILPPAARLRSGRTEGTASERGREKAIGRRTHIYAWLGALRA